MRIFWSSLSEKDRRRYAAIEACKLRHGIGYVSSLFGTSPKSINRGRKELCEPTSMSQKRIRSSGGGRKPIIETRPKINDAFLEVLADHTAGSPMKEDLKWTNLKRDEIVEKLSDKGYDISVPIVNQLFKKHDFRKRKMFKGIAGGSNKFRDKQFRKIHRLIKLHHRNGNPVISMDTKKKEYLGTLYRDGKLYTRETIYAFDHDFPSLAQGIIIPHALFDVFLNTGYIQLGTSHDTSEFACDSIKYWWNNHGKKNYRKAKTILLLCDCGGSNSARHYIFKQELQTLANEIGIKIKIAHYPPYCSKYNPIEHRLFPHVTRACEGVLFTSVKLVRELINNTKTKKGLKVFTNIMDKVYKTARKASKEFYDNTPIKCDKVLPQWNYTAIPNCTSK
jgi:hypothetical protein